MSTIGTKRKAVVTCHIPTTGNQFENVKPIEVKCFLDENRITIETKDEKSSTDTTAKMMTIVPQRKRPISAPAKKQIVTDVLVTKPIRHIAILPSSSNKDIVKSSTNLSETFTVYEGPATTPVLDRSLDETITIHPQLPIPELNFELPQNDDVNVCDNTDVSSVCELLDQPKLQQKPHSLIGRYQPTTSETSSKPIHIATVHYDSTEPVNKQVLIQQFYTQLEQMKATFHTESSSPSQITTNTLTFDDGQVKQISTTNQLQEKKPVQRISSAKLPPKTKHTVSSTLPAKKTTTTRKTSSNRIQSAPVTRATQMPKTTMTNRIASCKTQRIQIEKKSRLPIKDKVSSQQIDNLPLNQIEYRQNQVTLLPHEEQECQKMFDKLQRLQPNGVCVDINTLRRALYPPMGTTTYSSNINPISSSTPARSYRSRTQEMPQSWVKLDDKYVSQHVPKVSTTKTESIPMILPENTDIDRITDQLKKHAAINYSYYTRTK